MLERLLDGLWTCTAPHPDWGKPETSWDADVRGYLAFADDATLLIDPLLPPPEDAAGASVRDHLDALGTSGHDALVEAVTRPPVARMSE